MSGWFRCNYFIICLLLKPLYGFCQLVSKYFFLVFDPFSRKREPCDHYFNVDCGDRLELREFIDHWKEDKQR